ncbi:MAG: MFS transporter [Verrucomicrobiota bacterium]
MNKRRLFVASCISLLTTSMVFAIRGDIEASLSAAFHLSKEQMGLIWGPAFWGFTVAIFISGALVDVLGMRALHVLSSLGYIAGVLLVLAAPKPDGPVVSIFSNGGTTMLYVGFLAMGLSQGLVEGVINPLIATIYSDEKTRKLNVLHAWWPGGMVVGGITAVILSAAGASWQVKLATIMVPAAIYLVMAATQAYPKTERVTSQVSARTMFAQAGRPFFLVLFVCMWMTAATELGPDQWFPSVMKQVAGIEGIWFLMLTAGIMFVLRFFVSGWVHRFSPFAVMTGCSVVSAIGLYWLGSLQPGTSIPIAFLAATVFGFGKVYYWPTMLGVTAERFPKGGALLISLMGGAGFLSISFVLPVMGAQFDKLGPGAALRTVAVLPIILSIVFGAMYVAFRVRGGYRPLAIGEGGDPGLGPAIAPK